VSDAARALSPALVVAVDGVRSLASQLLARVLTDGGATVVEPGATAADVLVLIDPLPRHWERARELDAAVVLLCDPLPEGAALLSAVESGALAILSSRCEGADLVKAVWRVAEGDTAMSRAQTRTLCDALRKRPRTNELATLQLSRRELQILQSIDAGESMKQTARSLGISPRTVENTQRLLFRKLGVRNRAQAVARAYALGVIDHDAESRP
jgi:DNA-binding NarL/FixJ family response regulator